MKVNGSSTFKLLTAALLIGGSTMWVSCSKEDATQPSGASPTLVSPKTPYCLFKIINGASPYQFNVTKGTDASYGTVYDWDAPGNSWMEITSQTGTKLYAEGTTSPCADLTNYSDCEFDKNSTGPYYYITPNQGPSSGRKSLRFRVKTGVTVPTRAAWFTYNVSTNIWTPDPSAYLYFDYAEVTTFTTYEC